MTAHNRTSAEANATGTESESTAESDSSRSDMFADMPPSAKLVHFVLDHGDERTQTELVEETALSARTVRTALGRLEDAGLVTESVCLRDARKRVYSLESEPPGSGDAEPEAEA